MPPYFSTIFRARPPLEYVPPVEGLAPKNYRLKGYQPLLDPHLHILDRFEEKEKAAEPFETKQQMLARLKKQKIIKHLSE